MAPELQQDRAAPELAADWTENRAGHSALEVRELWHRRELVGLLALREVKIRYKQAAFGVAWAVLQPLAGMAVFTFVFQRIAQVASEGIPYPVFAYAGLALWGYFSSGVARSADALVQNSSWVTKVYFPRLIIPLAAVLPGLLDLGIALVLLGGLMAVYGVTPTPAILALPAFLVALLGVTLGIGLWLAPLNAQYRDVRETLGLLLQVGLFLSPVAYPASSVEGAWGHLYALNPMVGVLEGFRWAVLGAPWPGARLGLSLAVGAALLFGGAVYFKRTERRLADVI